MCNNCGLALCPYVAPWKKQKTALPAVLFIYSVTTETKRDTSKQAPAKESYRRHVVLASKVLCHFSTHSLLRLTFNNHIYIRGRLIP